MIFRTCSRRSELGRRPSREEQRLCRELWVKNAAIRYGMLQHEATGRCRNCEKAPRMPSRAMMPSQGMIQAMTGAMNGADPAMIQAMFRAIMTEEIDCRERKELAAAGSNVDVVQERKEGVGKSLCGRKLRKSEDEKGRKRRDQINSADGASSRPKLWWWRD